MPTPEQAELKEKKSFDTGELFRVKPGVKLDLSSFGENVEIDSESQRLLNIAMRECLSEKGGQNFAVIDVFTEEQGKIIHHLIFQPTLDYNSPPADMEAMEALYGKGCVVKPRDATLSGVVHQELFNYRVKQIEEKESKGIQLEPYESKLLSHKGKGYLKLAALGLSCFISGKLGKLDMLWTNRSTLQYHVLEINPIAKFAFYHDIFLNFPYKITQTPPPLFHEREYVPVSHLMRSIERKATNSLIKVTNAKIMQEIKKALKAEIPISSRLNRSKNPSIFYDDIWEKIRHDKKAIGTYLEESLYVALGLAPGPEGRLWLTESDHKVIESILQTAEKLEIKLNINDIPERLKKHEKLKEFKLGSPLFLAIKNKKIDQLSIINLLISQGAKLTDEELTLLDDKDKENVAKARKNELLLAIKNNEQDKIPDLISKGAKLSQEDLWLLTDNDITFMKNLEEKAEIGYGLCSSALMLALQDRNQALCEKLLEIKSDPYLSDSVNGAPPLFVAAEKGRGYGNILLCFLRDNYYRSHRHPIDYPLEITLKRLEKNVNVKKAIKELLMGYDIIIDPAQSLSGFTALHAAVLFGESDVTSKLLHAKANINAKINDKITALDLAVTMGHVDTALILCKKKFDQLDQKDHTDLLSHQEKNAYIKICLLAKNKKNNLQEFRVFAELNRLIIMHGTGKPDIHAFYQKYNAADDLNTRQEVLKELKIVVESLVVAKKELEKLDKEQQKQASEEPDKEPQNQPSKSHTVG